MNVKKSTVSLLFVALVYFNKKIVMYSRWSTSVISSCSTTSDSSASTVTETNIYTQEPAPEAFILSAEALVVDSARTERKAYKTEKFRLLMNAAESDLNKKYEEFINNPNTHPDYDDEWTIFWNRRYRECRNANETINLCNMKEEWVIIWKQILERKLKREIEKKKKEISRSLLISNHDFIEIEKMLAKDHETLSASRRPYSSSKEKRNKISSNQRSDKYQVSNKSSSISPRISASSHPRYSKSPSLRSPSPRKNCQRRNRSPQINSRSPQRRSRSSQPTTSSQRSRTSSQRSSRSPTRRIRSYQRSSHISERRSSSYQRASRSFQRKNHSLKRSSRSPQRRSRSPQRRSRSPQRRSRSPQRRSRSPQRRSRSPQRRSCLPQRRSRSPERKNRSSRSSRIFAMNSRRRVCMDFDRKRFNWTKPTVTSVLSLLNALEDMLGSLGPKVIVLMRKVIAMDKAKANSSHQLLDDEEQYVVFKTIREKLQGVLMTNLLEIKREKAVKKAIKDITYLVDETDKRVKSCRMESTKQHKEILKILSPQKKLSPINLISPLKSTTLKKITPTVVIKEEREAIAAFLTTAFMNVGITNVTCKQIQSLGDVYKAELARKKMKSDDKDDSSMDMIDTAREEIHDCVTNDAVNVAISSSLMPVSPSNVLAVSPSSEIPVSSLSNLPYDLPVSSALPISTLTDLPEHFHAKPDFVVNENEKVTLTDMELKILMKKFQLLSSKEQKTYQAYMNNLEVEDPDRFMRLTGNTKNKSI